MFVCVDPCPGRLGATDVGDNAGQVRACPAFLHVADLEHDLLDLPHPRAIFATMNCYPVPSNPASLDTTTKGRCSTHGSSATQLLQVLKEGGASLKSIPLHLLYQ